MLQSIESSSIPLLAWLTDNRKVKIINKLGVYLRNNKYRLMSKIAAI